VGRKTNVTMHRTVHFTAVGNKANKIVASCLLSTRCVHCGLLN